MSTIVPERIQRFVKVLIIAPLFQVALDVACKLNLRTGCWFYLTHEHELSGYSDVLIISTGVPVEYAKVSLLHMIQTYPHAIEYRNVYDVNNIDTLVEAYDIERRIKHLQIT